MARLNEVIGSVTPDDLIVDSAPSANVVTVVLAASVGAVKRGAVVIGTPGENDFALLTGAAAEIETLDDDGDENKNDTDSTGGDDTEPETEKALYIVADDADTKAESESGKETPVLVYRTGHFAREKVNEATGYTLTPADEERLRKSGILLSTLIDY